MTNNSTMNLGPNVIYTTLKKEIEVLTEGWTDAQIKAKSLEEMNQQIRQNELALDKLRDTLREQENRIRSLERIRRRKLEIGD